MRPKPWPANSRVADGARCVAGRTPAAIAIVALPSRRLRRVRARRSVEFSRPADRGFTQAVGKAYDFEVWLHGNSTMTITRLELVVTLRP